MHDAADALLAAELAARLTDRGLIFAARSEAQAARIARAARALAPDSGLVVLPAWDCLPFDRVSPAPAVMGRRMEALRRLAAPGPHLLVASVAALAQRLPPPAALRALALQPGDEIGPDALAGDLTLLGYRPEATAAQAGEFSARVEVIDIFPAAARWPVRIRLDAGGRVGGIDRFDPTTQRSRDAVERLEIGPASEAVFGKPGERAPGIEHRLPELYPSLRSVFDLLPGAALLLDPESDARMESWLAQVQEARATRVALCRASGGALPPDGLYLDAAEWQARRAGGEPVEEPSAAALPAFATERDPLAACRSYVAAAARSGQRVGISGPRLVRALRLQAEPAVGWAGLQRLPRGRVAALPTGLASGFATEAAVLIADADVWPPRAAAADPAALFSVPMRPGDAVIHLDHGMARLDGIEFVQTPTESDCLGLGFSGNARKLVDCREIDRVWRHGSGTDGVTLDRADGSTWQRRRAEIESSMQATAQALLAQVQARRQVSAPALRPPAGRMRRFVAGFAYAPTPDQQAAFDAVAADLARGWPMDRLVCGDVGFGKTEVALRAAAAAVLAGRQVAVLAPTTVLVRQHLGSFARRFAALGIEVAALSRLTSAPEARRMRERLASGELRLVIGTTALTSDRIAFAELGLVVIDEEQRFGARAKAALARLRDGVHTLTMTATPIPRTLEGALAGLHDLSILATPPAERLPVRTAVEPTDLGVVAAALQREHARGGQSFFVCPRIEQLGPSAEMLARITPDLSVVTLHGNMKPAEMDSAIIGFAAGAGDVLLSTDIIEAGLDIPRANTMLVRDADRLGLAQLHQLRGRVGRGGARASVFLFTDPDRPPTPAAARRLAALAAHDGIGAGFAVAAADLDLRGGGDLLGDEQAGHVRLLGPDLARHLLRRALDRARGEAAGPDVSPELTLGIPAHVPADYIPDAAARIALHQRLAQPHDGPALAEEIADRFGPPPDPVARLLELAELRAACRSLGVARLEAGPEAVACELAQPRPVAGLEVRHGRLLLHQQSVTPAQRLEAAWDMLHRLAEQEPRARAA